MSVRLQFLSARSSLLSLAHAFLAAFVRRALPQRQWSKLQSHLLDRVRYPSAMKPPWVVWHRPSPYFSPLSRGEPRRESVVRGQRQSEQRTQVHSFGQLVARLAVRTHGDKHTTPITHPLCLLGAVVGEDTQLGRFRGLPELDLSKRQERRKGVMPKRVTHASQRGKSGREKANEGGRARK